MYIKRSWRYSPEPYRDFEIVISETEVIFKEWWDPGRDPNRTTSSIANFEGSSVAEVIKNYFGGSVYLEVVESIRMLKGN